MPKVTRQEPPRPSRPEPSFPQGSLLASAVPVTSLIEKFVVMCIYGRNRSGKTTLAAQLPKPLLLISTEPEVNGGAISVSDMEGVYLQRVSHKFLGQDSEGRWVNADDKSCVRRDTVRGSEKLHCLARELKSSNFFKSSVLDTATSTQDMNLAEIMGWDKIPDMMSFGMVGKERYQYRAEKWRGAISPLLDLRTCNVVILCQEKDHNPPTDDFGGKRKILHTMQSGSFMAPALGGANAGWLQDACGYLFQIYEDELMEEVAVPQTGADGKPLPPSIQRIGTGKRQRHLRLLYHPNFAAGGRSPMSRNTPEFVTAATPAGLYAEMKKYIPSLGG